MAEGDQHHDLHQMQPLSKSPLSHTYSVGADGRKRAWSADLHRLSKSGYQTENGLHYTGCNAFIDACKVC